jgi:hypothetical protein
MANAERSPAKRFRPQRLPGTEGGPNVPATDKRLHVTNFVKIGKNTLVGKCNVELPIGLKIREIMILKSNGKRWAAMPSLPRLDKDKKQMIGENGKPLYNFILEWRDRSMGDRFSQAVLDALDLDQPGWDRT